MSARSDGVCGGLLQSYPANSYIHGFPTSLGLGEAIFGIAYFGNALIMLFWIYQQRRQAQKGVEGAALYVIFPVYIPFMYMSFVSDILVGALIMFLPINYSGKNDWLFATLAAFVYSLQHFVLEGIAFTLLQYGCGYQAAKQSAAYASVFALFTFFVQLIVHRYTGIVSLFADLIWNVSLLIFYIAIWMLPATYLFRRPSAVFYAKFWTFFRFLYIIGMVLTAFASNVTSNAGYCIFAFGNMAVFVMFKPYVIYRTLLADSIWWQGLGQQPIESSSEGSRGSDQSANLDQDPDPELLTIATDSPNNEDTHYPDPSIAATDKPAANGGILSRIPFVKAMTETKYSKPIHRTKSSSSWTGRRYRALSNPLLGMEVGFNEAQALANEVDNLRTDGEVRLLNFAYLSLKKSAPILGTGSYSKVYGGEYRGKPVAIKMLFTPDLNPEVIRRCCNEAQLLSRIQHENVVMIYGVSVLPPSVCIVLEKCHYGSLADVLRGSERIGGFTRRQRNRPPLTLTKADRMFLALGCCRGVAAIHQYSSTMVHRDIKSFNFLVDSQLVVKIADLELGMLSERNQSESWKSSEHSRTEQGVKHLRSSMMMSSWQSPEVISGKPYSQSSDVYSLAVVLWEIIASFTLSDVQASSSHHTSSGLHYSHSNRPSSSALMAAFTEDSFKPVAHSQLPFGNCISQREVRAKILAGDRPLLPKGFNSKYLSLIERGWQTDPSLRPTATEMGDLVEDCWQDCLHRIIYETPYIIDQSIVREEYKTAIENDRRLGSSPSSFLGQTTRESFSSRLTSKAAALLPPAAVSILMSSSGNRSSTSSHSKQPSPQLLASLLIMQHEERWLLLEDEGAFVVVTATLPFLIVWATKAWTKLTGYLLNDVLADCLATVIEGKLSDQNLLSQAMACASSGKAKHVVCTHYRKDNSMFVNSVHVMPVYLSTTTTELTNHNRGTNNLPRSVPIAVQNKQSSSSTRESDVPDFNRDDLIQPSKPFAPSGKQSSPVTSYLGSILQSKSAVKDITVRNSLATDITSLPSQSFSIGRTTTTSNSMFTSFRGSSMTGSTIGEVSASERRVAYVVLQFSEIAAP